MIFNDIGERLFFHIGYHRTGTTFFQKKILRQYADHAVIGLPYLAGFLQQENKSQAKRIEIRTRLSEYLESQRHHKKPIIYSSEALSGDVFYDNYKNPGRIKEIFSNCKIIISIRSQYTMIPSLYSYAYIKNGGTLTFERYMRKLFVNKKLDYFKLIYKYIDLFGEDSVYVAFYEELKNNPEKYLEDLFNFIGLPKIWTLGNDDKHRNPRFPMITVKGTRIVNVLLESKMVDYLPEKIFQNESRLIMKMFLKFAVTIINKLYSICHLPPIPDYEDNQNFREEIKAQYKNSNRKLFKLLDHDIDRYDYPS